MPDDTVTIRELRAAVADFVAQRQWQRYHDPKNLSMSIAIESAELMEHFQWLRSDELAAQLAEPGRRDAVRDELADITCYVLALANVLEFDLATAVTDKLRKNAAKYPVEQFRGHYHRPIR